MNKNNESLELTHSKWYRDLNNSNITIKEQLYNLKTTENKRELIYNNQGIAINTIAIKL